MPCWRLVRVSKGKGVRRATTALRLLVALRTLHTPVT